MCRAEDRRAGEGLPLTTKNEGELPLTPALPRLLGGVGEALQYPWPCNVLLHLLGACMLRVGGGRAIGGGGEGTLQHPPLQYTWLCYAFLVPAVDREMRKGRERALRGR